MDYTELFKELDYDIEKMEQIRLAYKNGVPEAIPDMMLVKDDYEKMEQIRLAYKNGVPEAIPEMLAVKHDWRKMAEIRLQYKEEKQCLI